MKIRTILAVLALLLGTSLGVGPFTAATLNAQSVPEKAKTRAENRAKDKGQNKIDESVDKAVDDAFNAMGSLFKKKKKKKKGKNTKSNPRSNPDSQDNTGTNTGSGRVTGDGGARSEDADNDSSEQAANSLSNLFGLGGDSDFEPFTNEATFSLTMETTTTNRRGKQDDMTIHLAMTTDKIGQEIHSGKPGKEQVGRMIFNTQTGKTLMITEDDGESQGILMKTPNLSGMMDNINENADDFVDRLIVDDTGETKIIDGYNTRKYIIKDPEEGTTTTTWLTHDIHLEMRHLADAMMAMMGGSRGQSAGAAAERWKKIVNGFAIVSTSVDKKGTTTKVHYRNIKIGPNNLDDSIMDTEGIEIVEVPGF